MIRLSKTVFLLCLAAALLAEIFAAGAAKAQTSEPAQIVLPARVVALQPATLAVLDKEGRLVPKANVMLSDGTPTETDATGRATFKAPSLPGVVIARLAGHHEIAAAAVVLPYSKSDKLQIDWAPTLISVRDRFDVRGSGFRGDAAGNTVQFGQQPALVLAASPASLAILLSPSTSPGTAQLSISANGSQVTANLAALVVEFNTGAATLAPGMNAALNVRVRGSDRPQEIDIENLAPAVMRFSHGDVEHVRTRGGVDNSAVVVIRALRAGDYSFRVRPTAMDPTSVDIEAARAYLIEAQKVSTPPLTKRFDPILTRLERPKPDARRAVRDINRLLFPAPPENVKFLMLAARDALTPR